MSIFQEYEETRDDIGHEMFDTIQKYLDVVSPLENYDKYNEELRHYKNWTGDAYIKKMEELKEKHKVVLFSDVIYNYDAWKKYEKWFNEEYKKRKVVITGAWKSSFDDVRYSARIYLDNKYLGSIIDKCDAPEVWEKELDNLYKFKDLVYCFLINILIYQNYQSVLNYYKKFIKMYPHQKVQCVILQKMIGNNIMQMSLVKKIFLN